jgi:hypothetical protein
MLLTLIGLQANLLAFEESRSSSCAYQVEGRASVEINNQYGQVQVHSWDKDSVKVEVVISASSGKQDDLQKLLDMVSINCSGNLGNVVASTEWSEGIGLLKKGSMDLKNILNTDKKLTVDYKVYLPQTSRLTINNRFGDVYLPDFDGAVRIALFHGDLRARRLNNARDISVKYGKVLLKSVGEATLSVEYGSLLLDKATRLTLNSKSSTLEILEVDLLNINSRNDELRVDKISTLRGECTFSHLRIKNIQQLVDLNTSYGDVTLRQVQPGFESIRMHGSNTDYDFEFAAGAAYRIDIELDKSKGFSYPQAASIKTETTDKDHKFYTGFIGNAEAKSQVFIRSRGSYITFYQL